MSESRLKPGMMVEVLRDENTGARVYMRSSMGYVNTKYTTVSMRPGEICLIVTVVEVYRSKENKRIDCCVMFGNRLGWLDDIYLTEL